MFWNQGHVKKIYNFFLAQVDLEQLTFQTYSWSQQKDFDISLPKVVNSGNHF